MELGLILMKQIGSMLLMLLAGMAVVRTRVMKVADSVAISKLLLYAVVPCAIINSFQIDYTEDKLLGLLFSTAAGIAVHIVFILTELALRRPLKLTRVEGASLIYTNAGSLVIPLLMATLGQEWVFYLSGYFVVQQILLWTHCKAMVSGERGLTPSKIFKNVNVAAVAVGVTLFLLKIKIPPFIKSAMEGTASMIAPAGMIVVGMVLGGMRIREIAGNPRAYLIITLRLVAFPLIVILLFALSGAAGLVPGGGNILLVSVIAAASSCATTVTQFAQLADTRAGYAGSLGIISVIFCVVSIPLLVTLYQALA